jgi:hypothetical protein
MKVYALRHKKTGQYSEGGRYAESTSELPKKIWYSYDEFLAFLKYYVNDQKKLVEYDRKIGFDKHKGWTIEETLKNFLLITFELEELTEKNDTMTKIIKDLIKDGKLKWKNSDTK